MERSSPITVLLIEDDPGDLKLMRKYLDGIPRVGFELERADTIEEAAERLEKDKFDVVLLDLSLPYARGLNALRVVNEKCAGTPIIVLTGADDEELAEEAMNLGARDYLVKGQVDSKLLSRSIRYSIELKKAEEALRESEEKFRTIAAVARDAIIVIDSSGKTIFWNDAACDVFGYTQEDVLGRDPHVFLGPKAQVEKQRRAFPLFQRTGNGDAVGKVVEVPALRKDGATIPVELSIAPVHKKDGWHAIAIVRDISERKKLDQMKNDFLSSVSHELKTPLTSIKGFTATILSDPDMPEETRREFLKIISKSSDRLDSLIMDLLDISRIDAGTLKVEKGKVVLSEILEEVYVQTSIQAREKSHVFEKSVECGVSVTADEKHVRQILTNLASNAIKFTPQEGNVRLDIIQNGDMAGYRVTDNGYGIPDDDIDYVFDKFYRVHRPGLEIQGTGLGLPIVKKLVENNGGKIIARSNKNTGTVFEVLFPRA